MRFIIASAILCALSTALLCRIFRVAKRKAQRAEHDKRVRRVLGFDVKSTKRFNGDQERSMIEFDIMGPWQ